MKTIGLISSDGEVASSAHVSDDYWNNNQKDMHDTALAHGYTVEEVTAAYPDTHVYNHAEWIQFIHRAAMNETADR